jgi:hypothetical protein
MSTHPYEYTHIYSIPINTSERLSWFDLEIYEFDHQECLVVDTSTVSH